MDKKIQLMKNKNFVLIILFIFTFLGCAKRGSITGGEKDITPPKIVSCYPKNLSTDFKENSVRITFDEYIKIKDLEKNLVVSPLMKNQITVTPQGGVSKQMVIKWRDTLKANTTYSFNFGESIIDNNEGNAFKNLKYVFSTGKTLDSLKLNGSITDAIDKKIHTGINVMLYEVDSKYNDSIVFKETPRYLANVSDSTATFTIENIQEGKYRLLALKETSKNYKYDAKRDKIAFHSEIITIPTTNQYTLKLFKEKNKFSTKKPQQASGNRILLPYEGNGKNIKLSALYKGSEFPIRYSKIMDKDSLQIWTKPIKNDSLILNIKNDDYSKSYTVNFRDFKKDTLHLSSKTTTLGLKENFKIKTATPLEKWDLAKFSLTKKGGAKVAFKPLYDAFNQNFELVFDKEENEKYDLKIMPQAIEDYLGQKNKDTLTYQFSTKSLADYGNLKLSLKNVKSFPLIVELTDNKGKVMYQQFVTKVPEVSFDLIEPQKYNIRVIYDTNNNQEWDSGSFIENRQPEAVYHFPTEIDVRANWDVNQDIDLGK